jgi:hypothetical protein
MSETIDDIVREMRKDMPRVVDAKIILRNYADRIEAAVKHQFRETTKTIPHEKVAVAENATTTPTYKDSLEVGNAARMREALNVVIDSIRAFDKIRALKFPKVVKSALENMAFHAVTALAKPPRNCDVGSEEEQKQRFDVFCSRRNCDTCPFVEEGIWSNCAIRWAQMPYESAEQTKTTETKTTKGE